MEEVKELSQIKNWYVLRGMLCGDIRHQDNIYKYHEMKVVKYDDITKLCIGIDSKGKYKFKIDSSNIDTYFKNKNNDFIEKIKKSS